MILDNFDAHILAEIQVESTTAAALAPRVKLSTSAVTKRLNRLRHSGLIARTAAILDFALIGPSITAFVLLSLDPDGPLTRDKFVSLVLPQPEITNVFLLAGDVGIAVMIQTRTLSQYVAFVRSLQESFAQIRSVRDYIVVGQPKRSLAIPFSLVGLDVAD